MHHIFQRLGITPDEFFTKTHKVRAFMLASMLVQLEAEAEQAEQLRSK